MNPAPKLFTAAGIAAPAARRSVPDALLLEPSGASSNHWMVSAIGRRAEVDSHPAARYAQRLDLPRNVLLPGLVNAHTHLDLTHLGPQPLDRADGFAQWAKWITRSRLNEPDELRGVVEDGLARSLAGGVVAVGDIAGAWRTEPVEALLQSGLLGVSFLEVFGVGAERERQAGDRLESLLADRSDLLEHGRARMGVSPHATYSIGPDLYRRCADLARRHDLILATHVAECPEERQVMESGEGPIPELLAELGLWSSEVADRLRSTQSPVGRVARAVGERPFLAVHVCDCSDDDIELLARIGASVAYCPRANQYFRYAETFGPHRYRDMLDAGINVCLGTDSIVCLPKESADRISTLDEMRFLHQRDGTSPELLLQMATTNGALALGLNPGLFELSPGAEIAGLIAVPADASELADPLRRVMRSSAEPELLLGPRDPSLT